MRFAIRVKPGAKRTRVGGSYPGRHGPALVVAVTAPAVDGRATTAALDAVAEALGIGLREVRLVSGERSRDKLLDIGSDEPAVRRRHTELLGAPAPGPAG